MRRSLVFLLGSLLCSIALAAACGSAPEPASAPAAASAKRVDPATAGSLSGRVSFSGTPPKPEILHVSADPVCMQAFGNNPQSDAVLVSADGAVQNAFVYIKDAFTDYTFDVPATAVTLDQRGCRYVPRVFGVRVGQAVDIINSDATLHNVHAMPMINSEFNKGQPAQGSRMTQVFTAPEVMVRFKCDVHGWMAAYGGVMSHPFFAVTGADGTFSITGLPPGQYQLAVWHEKLGTMTQTVTVGASQSQTANFTLAAAK
jgi:plastocyanin